MNLGANLLPSSQNDPSHSPLNEVVHSVCSGWPIRHEQRPWAGGLLCRPARYALQEAGIQVQTAPGERQSLRSNGLQRQLAGHDWRDHQRGKSLTMKLCWLYLKDKFTQKFKFSHYPLTPCQVNVWGSFVVNKTFLDLHSETELQHSAKQQK